jgi:hypothetical protein
MKSTEIEKLRSRGRQFAYGTLAFALIMWGMLIFGGQPSEDNSRMLFQFALVATAVGAIARWLARKSKRLPIGTVLEDGRTIIGYNRRRGMITKRSITPAECLQRHGLT